MKKLLPLLFLAITSQIFAGNSTKLDAFEKKIYGAAKDGANEITWQNLKKDLENYKGAFKAGWQYYLDGILCNNKLSDSCLAYIQ